MAKNLAASLRRYLKEQGSPLADHVPALIQAGRRYRVDPRLIVAISGAETSFGKAGNGPSVHNAWGIGPGRAYKSWDQGFNEMAKLLRTGYLSEGRTSFQALYPKYVWGRSDRGGDPNADWVRNASAAFKALGGNPNNVTKGWRGGTSPGTTRVPRVPAPSTPGGPKSGASDPAMLAEMPDFNLGAIRRVALGGDPVGAFKSMVAGPAHWAATHPMQPQAAPAGPRAARPGKPGQKTPQTVQRVKFGNLVSPLGTAPSAPGGFEYVDAEGAPDKNGTRHHAGMDWFAPGGSRVASPVGGKIVEVKASRGNSGQVFGGVVKVQDAKGRVFVFRHVDPRGVRLGQRVKPGSVIATVSPWESGSPHSHVEIWKTLAGGYNYENMLDPSDYFTRK